ncbi:nucleoside-diphosphate sugar epimerase [Alsobacter soli]|uniref:Nucleoside-diphosphate sugar epimerase n=1 Tax=Alsobacter soli TaxID=2109933 RepID=A0A2T1HYV4_9HYPH|nr:mitochondrial fission ELM1 family protein [Alsobacter soli]PSC06876.1 nucleoside-diphosphate sugar epimerase [Alsobacter soli]
MLPPETTCWIITDGKAGDENQCLGVAEALGLTPDVRRINPRAPWVWLMPWGPIDPRERPGLEGGPLAGPPPDIAIASGRRAAPSLAALKRLSGGKTFTVFLKDPRTGTGAADFIWVPEHDRLRGPNVLATVTSPHRVSAERIAAARAKPDQRLAGLKRPRVALLLGGDSKHHRFTGDDIVRLTAQIGSLAQSGAGLMATASRRSPSALVEGVKAIVRGKGGFFWDGSGENPYVAMLALADAIVVTADSANMVGEACATGRPVLVFEPSERKQGSPSRISGQILALKRAGAVRSFQGRLESYAYPALDSIPEIASAVAAAFARHRSTPT